MIKLKAKLVISPFLGACRATPIFLAGFCLFGGDVSWKANKENLISFMNGSKG